ncbi:MAG: YbaK/EbsC family protein [Pseudomonadota bacterium]
MPGLSASARKVQGALAARGFANRVIESDRPTRSAAEAARSVGCGIAQIAKSILFRGAVTAKPVMVIASGANRIDEARLAALAGEDLDKADAEFVRRVTGFAIGGVPPLGFAQAIAIFIDRDLLAFEAIWAAAGTPNAVFRATPAELLAMTGGRAVEVKIGHAPI